MRDVIEPVILVLVRNNSPRSAPLAEEPVALDGSTSQQPLSDKAAAGSRSVTKAAVIRGIAVMAIVVTVLVGAYFVPLPSIATARTWSDSLGPWFIWLFFLAYAIVPAAPVPRTAFTLTAGVLFPPAIAFVGATISSTIAAVIGFLVARKLGRQRITRFLKHPSVAALDHRLAQRGWLAVGSVRLIAVFPFSIVNYLAGLSSIRLIPFIAATIIGMTPGNAAVIFLGDALTGSGSPISLFFSAALFAVGVIGLIVDTRMPINQPSSKYT